MAPAASSSVMLYMCAAAFLAVAAHATDDAHHQYKTGDVVTTSCANLCESTLRSDKQSTTAKNTRDLALVAMDLLLRTTTKVDSVLRRHSGSGHHSRSTALTLQYCQLDYAAIARTVPKCRAMVKEYKPIYPPNPEVGNVYYNCVAMLGQAASDCWGYVLVDQELAKVVSMEVGEVFQRATLVRAMIEVMTGFSDNNNYDNDN
nr:unnamed protein product [Digitaria exilis]